MSSTVSKGLLAHFGKEVTETAHFTDMFDKLFDALNVSNFSASIKSLKPFKKAYKCQTDFRLKVHMLQNTKLIHDFILV